MQLLQRAGLYAQMWNRQREASEVEELARRVANDPEPGPVDVEQEQIVRQKKA